VSFGIAGGWSGHGGYVSATAYGDRAGNPPTSEQVAKVYGALRRAADEALDEDPDVAFKWRVTWRNAEPRDDVGNMYRATFHLELTALASSHDVMVGGPLWRRRASEVARRMRRALGDAIPMRAIT
jgi:hypothetical protein